MLEKYQNPDPINNDDKWKSEGITRTWNRLMLQVRVLYNFGTNSSLSFKNIFYTVSMKIWETVGSRWERSSVCMKRLITDQMGRFGRKDTFQRDSGLIGLRPKKLIFLQFATLCFIAFKTSFWNLCGFYFLNLTTMWSLKERDCSYNSIIHYSNWVEKSFKNEQT